MPKEIDLQHLDLAGIIRNGERIVWGSGTGEPVTLIKKFLEQRHRIGRTSVFLGGISYTDTLKPKHADVVVFSGFGAMARLRGFCRAGALRVIPCHLSALCGYFESGIIGSVFQRGSREICAFPARSLNAVARSALGFKKLLAASQILRCKIRRLWGLRRRRLRLNGK